MSPQGLEQRGPIAMVRILDSVLRKMEAMNGCKQGNWKGRVGTECARGDW